MDKTNIQEIFGSLVFDDREMRARLSEEVYASLKKTIDENVKLDENVADAVYFLGSDASEYINGQILKIDGGGISYGWV